MARYPSKQEKTIIIREINPEAFTSLLDYLLNTDMLRCQCDELHTIWSRRPARMEQGPTKEELIELANNHGVSMQDIGILTSTVLARWGRPAVEPVPDSERPWERDGWCDKEGMCWMGDGGGCGFVPSWRLCKPSDSCNPWSLPHWAIPVPPEAKQ